MTASGTAGHGLELARYLDYSQLGAIVVKSLAAYSWAGNPPPRLQPVTAGMLNSVGLQGPGLACWLEHDLPQLAEAGARVVVSVWGRTVQDYAAVCEMLGSADSEALRSVVAVEVNVSCPNLEDRGQMFSHSAAATAEVLAATEACGLDRWAKLSATGNLVEIASAAVAGGAVALTLINTVSALVIDINKRSLVLGGGGGGLSGAAIAPIALRAVYDIHAAMPDVAVVGVGGITSGADAVAMLMAGASAVQIGTAIFVDPRAPYKVLAGLASWCEEHGLTSVQEIIGVAHG